MPSPSPDTTPNDALRSSSSATSASSSSASVAGPVRSAKDAFNARYASQKTKVRPSASALFRQAKPRPVAAPKPVNNSMDPLAKHPAPEPILSSPAPVADQPAPVVRTTLSLAPKKSPRLTTPATVTPVTDAMRPKKGVIRLKQPLYPPAPIHSPAPAAERPTQAIEDRTATTVNALKAAAEAVVPASARKNKSQPTTSKNRSSTSNNQPPSATVTPSALSTATTRTTQTRPHRPAAPRVITPKPEPKPASKPTPKPTPSPSRPARGPVFQDIMRPKPSGRPADSVKNRFRPAPKGYASSDPAVAASTRPYTPQAYEPATPITNPSTSRPSSSRRPHPPTVSTEPFNTSFASVDPFDIAPTSTPPTDHAVHIYGMTEGPDESNGWVSPKDRLASRDDTLGVVEDYHPSGSAPVPASEVAEVVLGRHVAPPSPEPYDASAHFLKSVHVDKRPLSSAPVAPLAEPPAPEKKPSKPAKSPKSPFHFSKSRTPVVIKKPGSGISKDAPAAAEKKPAKSSSTKLPNKNVYPKKSTHKPSPKPSSDRPTVIIPASRRSHAPLAILLLITIILGALVGALAYLFFFQ